VNEFILFNAFFEKPVKEELQGSISRKQAGELLLKVEYFTRSKMFDYASIDKQKISALTQETSVTSLTQLKEAISKIQVSKLEEQLSKCCREIIQKTKFGEEQKVTPTEFALAFYLNQLVEKLFPPQKPVFPPSSESRKEIRLAANYQGWQIVKKISLEAEEKEVLACLVGIHENAARKAAEYLCYTPSYFSDLTEKILKPFPQRKILETIDENNLMKEISGAYEQQYLKMMEEKVVRRVFEYCGFPASISLAMIAETFPELKIPKPRGNFGKKK